MLATGVLPRSRPCYNLRTTNGTPRIMPDGLTEKIAHPPVHKEGILLDMTEHEFENEGVLNPACLQDGDTVHLYYRAVSKGNISTIGYCKLNGPTTVVERMTSPLIGREEAYESQGLEDPRVVKIDDKIFMTY